MKNIIELGNFREYQTWMISDLVQLWYHIEFHISLKTHQWWNEKLKEREKDDVKLVYEIHWINLQCSVLYIGRIKAGKDETEITNCLINLSCTRGIRDNKTH